MLLARLPEDQPLEHCRLCHTGGTTTGPTPTLIPIATIVCGEIVATRLYCLDALACAARVRDMKKVAL